MAITIDEFKTMLQKVGKLYKEALIDFGRETSTDNVIDIVNAIKAAATGDFGIELDRRADSYRRRFASLNSGGEWRAFLDPVFRSFLKDLADNKGNFDPASNWGSVVQEFIDSNYHVVSRGITFDTTPTESGTGTGNLYRLTVDRFGNPIESIYTPIVTTFRCVTDETGGAEPGEEEFEVSAPGGTDALDRGTGITFDAAGSINSRNSNGNFLGDASFQSVTAADSDPEDLGSWIDGDGTTTPTYGSAKYELVTTNTAMSSVEEVNNGQAVALEIKGNHTIHQELEGIELFSPYFYTIRVRPGGSLSGGTLTVTWGSKSQAYDLTSLTGGLGAYTTITPDLDKDLWGYQFTTTSPKFQIAITGLTGDTVQVDNVRFGEMDFYGGHFYWIDADTTQFLAGANEKKFTLTDTVSSDSIIQSMIHFAYGLYLPSVSDATEITAAGGRTLTFADSGSADTITASSGSFVTDGYQVGMLVTIAGTSNNNMTTGPIASVSATVLTFDSETSLTAEGPLSSTATLNATAFIPDPAA